MPENKQIESQQWLTATLNSVSDAVIATDEKGFVVLVNPVAEELTFCKKGEALTRRLEDVFQIREYKSGKPVDIPTARLLRQEIALWVGNEVVLVARGGRETVIDCDAAPIRDNDGNAMGIVLSFRDVTQRVKDRTALRQSEENYRTLFDSKVMAVFVIDAETFSIVDGNITSAQMFGYDTVNEVLGMNPLDFVHPDDRERAARVILEDGFENDMREVNEFKVFTRDGSVLWVSAVGQMIEYQGRMVALVSIRDITREKQAEEEKQRMEQQVQLAGRLAAIGELAAGVAHELNNPLTAVQGYAQLIASSKDLNATIKEDVEALYRESQRATRITSNLLSFARRHKPEKKMISINDVIVNSVELQEYRMKVNNIEISTELDKDLPHSMVDFHQMRQVFVNLITNAEQAMTEHKGCGKIGIKTRAKGDTIYVTLTDDGPGIDEENLKRIFDPFYTTKAVGKGTGLGLSICFGIVQEHDGRLYARSNPDGGSTFILELPVVSEEQTKDETTGMGQVQNL